MTETGYNGTSFSGNSTFDGGNDAEILKTLKDISRQLRTGPKHGLGLLDWVKGSFIFRSLEILGTVAIILGVSTFMMNMEDVKHDRDARAWRLLTSDAPGNSGKIEALEYFNKHNPLELVVPNPRRWGLPFGPKAEDDGEELPDKWEIVLVENYGPWKSRTPLTGIDLSRERLEGFEDKVLNYYDEGWSEDGVYLWGVELPQAHLPKANLSGANL